MPVPLGGTGLQPVVTLQMPSVQDAHELGKNPVAILFRVQIPGFEFRDRKSTRLNSSHGSISYAVFCLKKKKTHIQSRWGASSTGRRVRTYELTAKRAKHIDR